MATNFWDLVEQEKKKKKYGTTTTKPTGAFGDLVEKYTKESTPFTTTKKKKKDEDEDDIAPVKTRQEKQTESRAKTRETSKYLSGNNDSDYGMSYAPGQSLLEQAMAHHAKNDDVPVMDLDVAPVLGNKNKQSLDSLLAVTGKEDFKAKSGYASTKADGFWDKLSSKYGLGYNDLQYEYINNQNGIRDEISQRAMSWGSDSGKVTSSYEENALNYMKPDEIAVYNYYYQTEGKEKAQEFLDALAETLNARKAGEDFTSLQGNTASEILFGIEAGTHQFEQGVKNLGKMIVGKDDYIPQTATQILTGKVREDLADDGFNVLGNSLGQVAFDALNTGANMAPSILTSMAVGVLNPAAGIYVGSALMGSSAAGNAYQKVLNEGHNKENAAMYATSIGVLEATLQTVLGGIGKLGGTSAAIGKAVSGIENGLLRFSLQYGGKIGSEALEEGLQEVLDPLVKNAVLGTDEDVDWENVAYSALLGGLMGAGFGAVEVAQENKANKLTDDEKTVLDKIVDDYVAKQKEDGKNVTSAEKTKYKKNAEAQLRRGYVTVEKIEDILGGEDYANYKAELDSLMATDDFKAYESALKEQESLPELEKRLEEMKENPGTVGNIKAYDDLQSRIEAIKEKKDLRELAQKLSPQMGRLISMRNSMRGKVSDRVKGTRLAESYAELERRKEKYTADPTKYENEFARQTVQQVLDSGLGNGTNEFADKVEFMAGLAAKTGRVYKLMTEQELKEAGYWEEGSITHGLVDDDGNILLNYNSDRNLHWTVGHETGHAVEETGHYKAMQEALFKHAIAKEGLEKFNARLKEKEQVYKNKKNTTPEAELANDLLGEYVFTDYEFVRNLAKTDRTAFDKAFDTIKHLYKLAVAGSAQQRELEKAKHLFQRAIEEVGGEQKNTTENGGVKQAIQSNIVDTKGNVYKKVVKPGLTIYNKLKHDNTNFSDYLEEHIFQRTFSVPTSGGTIIKVEFAKDSERIQKDGDESPRIVRGEFIAANTTLKKIAILNIRDLIKNSEPLAHKSENKHQWLDTNGWDDRIAYMRYKGKDGDKIYPVIIHIANARDGRHILYDVSVFEKEGSTVDMGASALASLSDDGTSSSHKNETKLAVKSIEPSGGTVAQPDPKVKTQHSFSKDSEGNQLSKAQIDYFKDSKVVDKDGNLLKVYHTTNNDFTVFDKGRKGETTGDHNTYLGFFFADDPEYMSQFPEFENGKTETYYLNMKNPIDMNNISKQAFLDIVEATGGDVQEAADLYDQEYADELKRAEFRGDNSIIMEMSRLLEELTGDYFDYAEFYKALKPNYDQLMSKGYDGIINTLDGRGWANEYIVLDSNQAKLTSNKNPTKDPDIRFSMSKAVEESKDLVALHNLTADKLLKSLELGGLPMPSIAITKADIPHDNFGDITLILGKDSIDPKANKKNVVYSADAWTPTFPMVEYESDSNVERQINRKLLDLATKVEDVFKHDIDMLRYGHEDNLNRYGGEEGYIQYVMEKYGMKAAYLEDQGHHIENVTKQVEVEKGYNSANEAKYQATADILGVTSADEIGKLNLKETIEQYGDQLEDIYPGVTKSAMRFGRFLGIVKSYIENKDSGTVYRTVTDESAMRKAVDDAIDMEGFEAWTRNLFSGIVKDSGIYNNKDIFTPSGNRRSFKQTHLPFTLENIVKAMASQNQGNTKNVSGFNGIKSLRAGTAERFKSIEAMHERKGRLQHLTQEEADKINDDLSTRLFAIIETIDNEDGNHGESNSFIRFDSIGEILMEVSEGGKYNVADIQKVFAQYRHNISDDLAADIKQLLFDVSQMPVNIYEAKPERAVSFDEVGVFVIPRNADVKLKQELLNRGYSIAEYDPDVEGDRNKVVNQFEEYKFSLSDASEYSPTERGAFNDRWSDFDRRDPLDIAPVAEENTATQDVAPVRQDVAQDAAPIAQTAEEMFPDDHTSLDAELDSLNQRKEALEEQMLEMSRTGNFDDFQAVNTEWEAVSERINALEKEASEADADRMDSLMEEIPPEPAEQYDGGQADVIPITKKLAADIARDIRSSLGLSNKHMADVRSIIDQYTQSEFPSREQLFEELKEKFGAYTESVSDDSVQEAKSYLRSYPIYVDNYIKSEIVDYEQLRKDNGKHRRLRFSEDGTEVDVLYHELNELYPHLFPESILNPTDQFLQIVNVANMDTVTNVEQELPDEAIWNVADSIMSSVGEYRQAQKLNQANKHARESFGGLMQDADAYAPPIDLDRVLANRRNPVGTTTPDAPVAEIYDTQHKKGVAEGQQAMWNDPVPETITRKVLHERKVAEIDFALQEFGGLEEVLKNAKNLSTWQTVDNTPQRVMKKALGFKEGDVLADLTVNKVAQATTEGTKWLNTIVDRKGGLLAQLSKRYNIKPKSKEIAAAQMYAEGFYVNENDEYVRYGDAELAQDFPDAKVQANIKALVKDPRIRQFYDSTLAEINASRTRNAYPEIPRLDNYYLHYRAMGDTFSQLGLPFNPNDIKAKDLPADLNGVTADLKPGQPYFASSMHRKGKKTTYDLFDGMERYARSAMAQIYYIDHIQTLRALRNHVADTYGQANGLEGLDALTEEEAQERIEQVFGSHLSTFAKFLNEEANVLAGKTALIDRGMEGILGRRAIQFINTVNSQTGSNLVGYNVSSSLTNFDALFRGFAKSNKADFVKAFGQFVYNKVSRRSDGFAENSPVIIRRKGSDVFNRTLWQKLSDPGYVMMSVVDEVSTEIVARAKYNELTRKGMDSQQAHFETDKWVSSLMGDRSLGQQPQLYNSKVLGLLTKFQLEVRNNLDSMFYDSIQDAKVSNEHIQNSLARNAKTAAKATWTIFSVAVAQHVFGKAFESVAGYNPTFDIIDIITKAFGWDDDEEDEDTVGDNLEQAFQAMLEDLPYTSIFRGGRIPIQNALPIEELLTGKDQYGNEKSRWQTIAEAAPYYLLPGGYGQIKKTKAGLDMFSDEHPVAGSYTNSGNLRFPVEDTFANRAQAAVFGQYASENARYYFDNDIAPLNPKQTQEYIDVDLPIRDYWDYREGLKGKDTLGEKLAYINSLDLPIRKQNILANNLTDRKEPIDMADWDKYDGLEEYDYAKQYPEKHKFLESIGISYDEYESFDDDTKEAYSWAYQNPEKYTMSKAVTSDLMEYKQYTKALSAIKADKDAYGDTISGSAKDKKTEYINNLNLDYGQKIILYRSLYNSQDDRDMYNADIVEYLNSRNDLSYDEIVTILKELDFTVLDDGTVLWD